MRTTDEDVREIRARWKADAEAHAARLTKEQLEHVHRELVQESNAVGHQYRDVLIYIDAIRAEYTKRLAKQP